MSSTSEKQTSAALIARWALLLPLSFASAILVAVIAGALFGPEPSQYSNPWAVLPAALSMGLAAVMFLAMAHGMAPFWKPGVVAALAILLIFLNFLQASSAIRALLFHNAEPKDRIRLAEAVGILTVALTALAVSLHAIRAQRSAT